MKSVRSWYLSLRAARYNVSPARQEQIFRIRDGEDPYLALARQMDLAKPWELAALALKRQGDEGQIRAMELILLAKYTRLTKLAVVAATASAAAASAAVIVAL